MPRPDPAAVATFFGHMHLRSPTFAAPATPEVIRRVEQLLPIPTSMVEMVPLVHLLGTVVRFIPVEHLIMLGMARTPMNMELLSDALAPVSRVVMGNLRLQSPIAPPFDMSTSVFVMTRLCRSALLNRDVT